MHVIKHDCRGELNNRLSVIVHSSVAWYAGWHDSIWSLIKTKDSTLSDAVCTCVLGRDCPCVR